MHTYTATIQTLPGMAPLNPADFALALPLAAYVVPSQQAKRELYEFVRGVRSANRRAQS